MSDRAPFGMIAPSLDAAALRADERFVHTGPVLVGCDGTPTTHESLFRAAQRAAHALGGPVRILGVCEPTPEISTGFAIVSPPASLDDMRRDTLRDDIERVISISSTADMNWDVAVAMGSTARTLADEARAIGAAAIVMGLGRHNPLDRLFGAETTLATLRESSVPVLAVGTEFPTAPERVVVGMDFTASSVHAAKLAARLMRDDGRLTLVHVRPRFEQPSAEWQTWDTEYARTLPPLFDHVRDQLPAPDGARVETVVVRGDPAPALLAFAQHAGADLIALGTQRHGIIERLVVGSVTTRVLRTARCAVLAVPMR